jgi:2-aminoethylphosphonate-pyruvate transaminase
MGVARRDLPQDQHEVLERLPEIINGRGTHVTVPMQGSGTFAVEAMLTTFVPRPARCCC